MVLATVARDKIMEVKPKSWLYWDYQLLCGEGRLLLCVIWFRVGLVTDSYWSWVQQLWYFELMGFYVFSIQDSSGF